MNISWAMVLLTETAAEASSGGFELNAFSAFFLVMLGMAASRFSTIQKQKREEKQKAAQQKKLNNKGKRR